MQSISNLKTSNCGGGIGIFLTGGFAFIAMPGLMVLLQPVLSSNIAGAIAFLAPMAIGQILLIWVQILAPLERVVRRRLTALGTPHGRRARGSTAST